MLTNPAAGGTPIMPSAATLNAPMVSGIRRPAPSISLTACTCSSSARLPAQRNSVIFMIPWWTRWTTPPIVDVAPTMATPMTM